MKKILFMGMPGAGKGTQAELLLKKKIYEISVGEVLRKEFKKKKSPLSPYKKAVQEGALIPDEVIFNILKAQIKKLPKDAKGYILDGAVRNLDQAKYAKDHDLIDTVLFYKLSRKTALKRLLNRHEGRADDNLKSIKHRFDVYKKQTKPVLKYLKKNFNYHKISGEPAVKEIFKETLKALK